MRLNMKQPVLDYEGQPLLVNKTNPDGTPVLGDDHRPVQEPETLRSYLVTALNNKARTETEPTGAEDAAKRYQLSTKLYLKNEVDLTVAECGLLQDRIKALYADVPLILGRVCAMIEGETIEVPEDDAAEDVKPATQPQKKA